MNFQLIFRRWLGQTRFNLHLHFTHLECWLERPRNRSWKVGCLKYYAWIRGFIGRSRGPRVSWPIAVVATGSTLWPLLRWWTPLLRYSSCDGIMNWTRSFCAMASRCLYTGRSRHSAFRSGIKCSKFGMLRYSIGCSKISRHIWEWVLGPSPFQQSQCPSLIRAISWLALEGVCLCFSKGCRFTWRCWAYTLEMSSLQRHVIEWKFLVKQSARRWAKFLTWI